MRLRIASLLRPAIAVLAITMLVVALACAGEEATPTSEPVATSVPATATSPPVPGGVQPTATPVEQMGSDTPWMDRYLQSPGYDPEWGQPIKGGTFIFGAQRDSTTFYANNQGCCYTHGCFRGLPWSSLFGIDAWTGDLTAIEGELVESWDMSDDGLTLTLNLRQGIMFFDQMAEKSIVPAEYNGGQILGDELVCEDAAATYQRYVFPPDNVSQFLASGRRNLNHLESTSCPDGPRGHTFVMHFDQPLAKTIGIMAGDGAQILDKDYVAWLQEYSDREDKLFGRTEVPENFYSMHGTGPFIPMEFNQSVSATYDANPNYWKEGLPLLDRYHNVVIKDIGSRFTALATGKIHYMGEGSWSMTPRPGGAGPSGLPGPHRHQQPVEPLGQDNDIWSQRAMERRAGEEGHSPGHRPGRMAGILPYRRIRGHEAGAHDGARDILCSYGRGDKDMAWVSSAEG